ncbi:hypothetical protein MMC17_000588 [Xylographa soralifera]|nr:hypothetical protein [Xylographa soralifera]
MSTPTGLALLRLAPLLSSTVNLMFTIDEHIFLSTWMKPAYRDRANMLLPSWFEHWLARGIWVILISYPFSLATALANIFTSRVQLQAVGATRWYWGGFLFTLAHFLYAPPALKMLNAIPADVPKGQSTTSLRTWLKVNAARGLTADLPAWIFFLGAAVTVRH